MPVKLRDMPPSSNLRIEIPASFRANAGLAVLNARGQVLAVERSDSPGAWQLPQGGIDSGETALEAAYRELQEETFLAREEVELVGEYPDWLVYELPTAFRRPKTGLGQAQKWFFFRLTAAGARRFKPGQSLTLLPPGGENRALAFKDFEEVARKVPAFRRDVYAKVGAYLRGLG
jgi:putative (di)nucleoside polyphosphate hydrolase